MDAISQSWEKISVLRFQCRSQAKNTFNDRLSLYRNHLGQQSLGALGCAAAKMALPALGAYQNTRPGQAKTLGGRLMGLQLELTCFLLSGHSKTPLNKILRLVQPQVIHW